MRASNERLVAVAIVRSCKRYAAWSMAIQARPRTLDG
jgi:hypothetical protein